MVSLAEKRLPKNLNVIKDSSDVIKPFLLPTAIGELMAMSGATPKHLFFLNLTSELIEDEEQVAIITTFT